MTQPVVSHDRVVDLVWARSVEKIMKGDGPSPVRQAMGDDIDAFIAQVATGALLEVNPAFAKVLYSSASTAAKRNSFFAMRRLGMPSDFFWKFDMWSDEKAHSTLAKVVERIFKALLQVGRQGLLKFNEVDVPATRFTIEFSDCAECHGVSTENVACYFHAGTFAGIFSAMLDVDLECVELQCTAAGAESCKFVVGLPDDRELAVPFDRNMENVAVTVQRETGGLRDGESARRLVDIGYYQMLLSSAIAGNLSMLEAACFKTGVAVGEQLGELLESRPEGVTHKTISSIYHKMKYVDLVIDSGATEIVVTASGVPETTGPLSDAAFVPFLAGELQSLISVTNGPVKYKSAEKQAERLVVVFVPEV
jgi:predicted hydrocarbon binding protein